MSSFNTLNRFLIEVRINLIHCSLKIKHSIITFTVSRSCEIIRSIIKILSITYTITDIVFLFELHTKVLSYISSGFTIYLCRYSMLVRKIVIWFLYDIILIYKLSEITRYKL